MTRCDIHSRNVSRGLTVWMGNGFYVLLVPTAHSLVKASRATRRAKQVVIAVAIDVAIAIAVRVAVVVAVAAAVVAVVTIVTVDCCC